VMESHRVRGGARGAHAGAVAADRGGARLGTALGLAFYALDGLHRRIADANLATAFPKRTAAERRAITRQMFAHFGRLLLELLKFSTLRPEQMQRLVEYEGQERARAAYAQGRGVLFFTGHFGYWEMQAMVHAQSVGPISVLARALDNPHLHALLEGVRGGRATPSSTARARCAGCCDVLQQRGGVAMLIDQHMHSRTPSTWTSSSAPPPRRRCSRPSRSGPAPRSSPCSPCPPRGAVPHDLRAPVQPPASDSPDAIREFTQRCTDVLEMYVRRHPALWLWMHRRWRDAPVPDAAPGMFPSARSDQQEA
jgi:Kdo2-lipid IVA lauroyltransferase/acyltransferase